MVIRDIDNDTCAVYEIKHSNQCVQEQARHLMNEDMIAMVTLRFGTLGGRFVLYLGDDLNTDKGIAYRNAEQFLKKLPNIDICSGLEEAVSEDEDQGFNPAM